MSFGEKEAQHILDAGWRQGSVFRPPAKLVLSVPPSVSFDREKEWLVVCTQSCTVVSRDLEGDPNIEFLVAGPVEHYKANSPEATGKTLRRFHLPVSGPAKTEALECDINRRFFVPRTLCLNHAPETGILVLEDGDRKLAGWIARYYTRVALPNELVNRAKGLFDSIKTALKKNTKSGERLSNSIDRVLVSWSPDAELQDETYTMNLIFLCADDAVDQRLHSLLDAKLKPFTEEGGHDGIKLVYENMVKSETYISQLDGYKRLSEWDYLSNLGDVAESGH